MTSLLQWEGACRTSPSPRFSVTVRDAPARRILTVSELTSLVRGALEEGFFDVWVEGEVSNLRAPGSGHLYCTLKDDACQIRAVLFRSTAVRLRFALEDGLHIVGRGRLSVYEPRGEYQLVLEYAEPKGVGALQVAFEQLKQRLAAEGLFDAERKRPLPFLPRTVGIVTSPTGAVIRDMIAILHRRCPSLRIVVAPVRVQGAGSAEQIAEAIETLNGMEELDVILVGRGGGSIEDLWSFNEEVVVRAIAGSRVPIVSAVGHETDVTLADFAADVRAPTPSAAAEAAVPVLIEVRQRLLDLHRRAEQAVNRRCEDGHRSLELAHVRLAKIRLRIWEEAQRVDEAVMRMAGAAQRRFRHGCEQVHETTRTLVMHSPLARIRHGRAAVPQLAARLHAVMRHLLDRRAQALRSNLAQLYQVSPLATLDRGYSVLEAIPSRIVLKSATQACVGQDVLARLAQGRLLCTVKEIVPGAETIKTRASSL